MPDVKPSPILPRHEGLLQVVKTMNCGLIASDLHGIVRYANPRALAWLRYTWDEVVGHSVLQLGVPEHAHLFSTEIEAIRGGDLRARLVVARRKDSTTFPAIIVPQRLHDDNDRVIGTFSIVIDLGTVQTAKPVGLEGENTVVAASMLEILRHIETLREHADASTLSFDPDHSALAGLSRRELEVLEHLMVGERVAGIAQHLFISEHTVRNHLKSMFRKTGSQGELVSWVRGLS